MINLNPYENLFYLYFVVLLILPSIILCFLKKRIRTLNLIISVLMTSLVFGIYSIQFIEFMLFIVCELILIFFFYYFRKRCKSELAYYVIFLLSLMPIFVVRISAFHDTLSKYIGFIGISYMCFKIWQLLFDIHDEKIKSLNLLRKKVILSFLLNKKKQLKWLLQNQLLLLQVDLGQVKQQLFMLF
jgi:membrane protein involved in D-alanine export